MEQHVSDYRNNNILNILWVAFLCTNGIFSFVVYFLNKQDLEIFTNSSLTFPHLLWIFIVIQAICLILSTFFKYSQFRIEIAWVFAEAIGIIGFSYFYIYGYNPWFFINFAISFMMILILGPFLRFN